MANEIMKKEDGAVATYRATANLGDLFAEELDGLADKEKSTAYLSSRYLDSPEIPLTPCNTYGS